jgi:hypothetical protein
MLGNKKLLICISFYNNPEKIKYLKSIISRFNTYELSVDVIIDTNSYLDINGAKVIIHENLNHPWNLTWMHRRHIKQNIDLYDYFMYVEDDMDIPFNNFKNYITQFSELWEIDCVPSFIRVEKFNDKEYVVDITENQCSENIKTINNKNFIHLTQPYHAFWIMPQEYLKNVINENFDRIGNTREEAAWYPGLELNKKQLVMVENNQISKLCHSYHLTNNYSSFYATPFGKIETNKIINRCK